MVSKIQIPSFGPNIAFCGQTWSQWKQKRHHHHNSDERST